MTPSEKATFNRSYEAYKRNYITWKSKGYAMDVNTVKGKTKEQPMKKSEYADAYIALKDAKMPNIARTVAESERIVGFKRAREIVKIVKEKNISLKGINKDISLVSPRDVINVASEQEIKVKFTLESDSKWGRKGETVERTFTGKAALFWTVAQTEEGRERAKKAYGYK